MNSKLRKDMKEREEDRRSVEKMRKNGVLIRGSLA